MAEKKTAGQHIDNAIAKTRSGLKRSKEYVKRKLKREEKAEQGAARETRSDISRLKYIYIAVGVLLLIVLAWLVWPSGGERATMAQAQDIAKMLKADGVQIQGIQVSGKGYEVTYAAESAADRFDDAMLWDWATIYGVSAAHQCEQVSIVTTLDGMPLHKQTATCDMVRALARGVLSEDEFWMLVRHESLA